MVNVSRLPLVVIIALSLTHTILALDVTMTVKIEGNDKPVVTGTTNLPDGTELMVTITRAASAYMGQQKVSVLRGAFRAGPFSQKGTGLNPGIYAIEVSSPLSVVQPAAVRALIGQDGSNLKGPLAKKSEFGGKVVAYKTSFKVGSGNASTAQDSAARAQAKKDSQSWLEQSCRDTCNLGMGIARSRGESYDWNRCYKKCLSDEPRGK